MASLFPSIVRFKGEFEYHGLYTLMKSFFLSRDFDFYETRYKDKGNEFEVEWTAEREYDEYHRVGYAVKFHAWDVEKLQVERYGKPLTRVKARIQLTINPKMEHDFKGYDNMTVFGEGRFDQFLKKMHKRVTQREEDEYWDAVMLNTVADLRSQIKEYLGMQGIN